MGATDDAVKVIPFFYYDLVARMIPGGLTLALLLLVNRIKSLLAHEFPPPFQSLQTVVVSLVLAGLAYMIGTVYETLNDGLVFWRTWSENKAFLRALKKLNLPVGASDKEALRARRIDVWETMVYGAALDPKTNTLFTHCHRFQAEYKMLLHLIYPICFSAIIVGYHYGMICYAIVACCVLCLILGCLAYRRDTRRWNQVLVFVMKLAEDHSALFVRLWGKLQN